jgi:hypothetical protein
MVFFRSFPRIGTRKKRHYETFGLAIGKDAIRPETVSEGRCHEWLDWSSSDTFPQAMRG